MCGVMIVHFYTDHTRPTLGDLLEYLTGSSSIPPSGFGEVQPAILFDESHDGLPIVSTCAMSITFPATFPIDQFKEKMDLAILGSKEWFGLL